ncbi:unnamed protein product [Acanthoscelides obtectus]|uniref:Uncharacterized protein n=1 Tax=Acanthoscelides obtectus TaxID=200917 RepID=A0A9P0KMA1_ACAOB|nr:unnamed protein product [Acanthoscelides obtectus]CAK1677360.1 hypothetical protein AOBTE_LOCUS31268 [Acanthoscelides obtectus]
MFRREKSQDRKQPVQKQKSIGSEGKDLLKAFSFRDKPKGCKEAEPKKKAPPSKGGTTSGRGKGREGLKQDDFLKATMRIFLVVSPPAGKLQVKLLYKSQ